MRAEVAPNTYALIVSLISPVRRAPTLESMLRARHVSLKSLHSSCWLAPRRAFSDTPAQEDPDAHEKSDKNLVDLLDHKISASQPSYAH